MGDNNPSLRVLETATCGLEWEVPGADTCLQTRVNMRVSSGHCGLTCWRAQREGSEEQRMPASTSDLLPRLSDLLAPWSLQLWQKESSHKGHNEPREWGNKSTWHKEGEGRPTDMIPYPRIKPRACKPKHCSVRTENSISVKSCDSGFCQLTSFDSLRSVGWGTGWGSTCRVWNDTPTVISQLRWEAEERGRKTMGLNSYPNDMPSLGLTFPICTMKGYPSSMVFGAMNMCGSCVSDV